MTLDEIKENVAHLTPDERFELAAFLRHVEEREDPEYQRKLDEADARISKGHSVTLKELRQMIKAFDAGEL